MKRLLISLLVQAHHLYENRPVQIVVSFCCTQMEASIFVGSSEDQ